MYGIFWIFKGEYLRRFGVFFFLLSLLVPTYGEEWFRSDATGLPLGALPRLAALREDYGLSIQAVASGVLLNRLPPEIRELVGPADLLSGFGEERVLYHGGGEYQRLLTIRDSAGHLRLSYQERPGETAFLERYDGRGRLTEERRWLSDVQDEWITYRYSDNQLVQAQGIKVPDGTVLWIDRYYYERAGALRRIERQYTDSPSQAPLSVRFSKTPQDTLGAYGADQGSPLAASVSAKSKGPTITYTTDSKGRVLTETRYDGSGRVVEELRNTYRDNRLSSTLRLVGGDSYRREYGYDTAGNRIEERDYHGEILERTLKKTGNQEVEELYMDGKAVMRTIWRDGIKISEERIVFSPKDRP
jgi:hypothetical protein